MVIDGKPVRLILQGDRPEAAKWIPYFAGKCREMSLPWQKVSASKDGMRGWARRLGDLFEIYVEVLGGLRYFDVSGYVVNPGASEVQHHVDFLAWKIPDAKLAMAGDQMDPVTGELRIGNSVRIGPFQIMDGYFGDYNNSVVRIGGTLFTCYAGESADVFGVLLFRSKDVTKDQKDATVLLEMDGLASNRHAIWAKDVLFLRDAVIGGVPKDFANCGQVAFLRMQHTATSEIDRGMVLATWTETLIDHAAVSAAGGYLAALLMRRGRSVDLGGVTQRIVYLSFWECYESIDTMYRWVLKMDVDTGEFLASTRIAQPYSLDSDPRRIEGLIDHYLSWEGEFGDFFGFSVGTLTGVSEAMRVQTYDLWLLDRETLAVVAVSFNCGIAQLGVYRDGCWAVDFRWAEFQDSDEDPEHVRFMTVRGFLQQMARDESGGVPVFTRVKDRAEYPRSFILQGGNYAARNIVEEGSGFIERYDH